MYAEGYDLSSGILTDEIIPSWMHLLRCQKINHTLLDASVKMPEDKSYPPGYIC
jgi:hypothetical protein